MRLANKYITSYDEVTMNFTVKLMSDDILNADLRELEYQIKRMIDVTINDFLEIEEEENEENAIPF